MAKEKVEQPVKVRWCTFNVRCIAAPDEKIGCGWEVRKDNVAQYVLDNNIDVVGVGWGAYALSAYLSILTQTTAFPTYQSISAYLEKLVTFGCVDGVTKKTTASVDGFAPEIEKEIIEALHRHITSYA